MVDSNDNPTNVDIAIALNRNSMPAWTIFVNQLTQDITKFLLLTKDKPRTSNYLGKKCVLVTESSAHLEL